MAVHALDFLGYCRHVLISNIGATGSRGKAAATRSEKAGIPEFAATSCQEGTEGGIRTRAGPHVDSWVCDLTGAFEQHRANRRSDSVSRIAPSRLCAPAVSRVAHHDTAPFIVQ